MVLLGIAVFLAGSFSSELLTSKVCVETSANIIMGLGGFH